MADAEWFEVPACGDPAFPNIEAATAGARKAAAGTDDEIEIYQCTRTKVRTVQRRVTVEETDVPKPA
jgi:hypothetical protein